MRTGQIADGGSIRNKKQCSQLRQVYRKLQECRIEAMQSPVRGAKRGAEETPKALFIPFALEMRVFIKTDN